MTTSTTTAAQKPKKPFGRFLYTIYDIGRIYRQTRDYTPPENIFFARKRLAALLVDLLLLSLVCSVTMAVFYDALARIHVYGELGGMALFVLYHGCMNSKLFGGATLGKKLFGLQTTDKNGQLLSVWRSLWRSFVLSLSLFPCYIFFMLYGFGVLTFRIVLIFATVYLFIFNRATRQSLHDYAARSFVYASKAKEKFAQTEKPKLWKGHKWVTVLFLLLVLSFLGSLFAALSSYPQHNEKQLAEVTERLQNTPQNYFVARVHTIPIYARTLTFPLWLRVELIRPKAPKTVQNGLRDAQDVNAVHLKGSVLSVRARDVFTTIRFGVYTGLVNRWTEWREKPYKLKKGGFAFALQCYGSSLFMRAKICRYIDKNGVDKGLYTGRGWKGDWHKKTHHKHRRRN